MLVINSSRDKLLPGNAYEWTEREGERISHQLWRKEEAMEEAKNRGIDYLFFVDVDNFLTNENGKLTTTTIITTKTTTTTKLNIT